MSEKKTNIEIDLSDFISTWNDIEINYKKKYIDNNKKGKDEIILKSTSEPFVINYKLEDDYVSNFCRSK